MFCGNCGSSLPEGSKFCGSCGTKTEMQPVYSATQGQTAPPITPPVSPRPTISPQNPYAYSPQQSESQPLSVRQYIVMFLLLCVPILNIILLLKWSFGASVNPSKRNFARASLILLAVAFVFILVGGGAIMGALEGFMR